MKVKTRFDVGDKVYKVNAEPYSGLPYIFESTIHRIEISSTGTGTGVVNTCYYLIYDEEQELIKLSEAELFSDELEALITIKNHVDSMILQVTGAIQ